MDVIFDLEFRPHAQSLANSNQLTPQRVKSCCKRKSYYMNWQENLIIWKQVHEIHLTDPLSLQVNCTWSNMTLHNFKSPQLVIEIFTIEVYTQLIDPPRCGSTLFTPLPSIVLRGFVIKIFFKLKPSKSGMDIFFE